MKSKSVPSPWEPRDPGPDADLSGVFSFAGRTYKLNVMFDDVNGLKVGNEVRFAGVPVGKVDDIVVDGSKVKVVMKMDEKQKIPRNSQFAIGMDGVMGTKFVTMLRRKSPPAWCSKPERPLQASRREASTS